MKWRNERGEAGGTSLIGAMLMVFLAILALTVVMGGGIAGIGT